MHPLALLSKVLSSHATSVYLWLLLLLVGQSQTTNSWASTYGHTFYAILTALCDIVQYFLLHDVLQSRLAKWLTETSAALPMQAKDLEMSWL